MNPFFFGRSARQLFGAYEPPATNGRDLGIVLCPALGDEHVFAYPTYRFLARQLAGIGCHVLRFDYYGTGDSAGDFVDTTREDWLRDIDTAITELKDLSQVSRIGLLGLRFGGTLAAQTARTRGDIDPLILWDVVCDGRAYLEEIRAASADPTAIVDACGLEFSGRARRDIETVTLDTFGPPLPKTLMEATSTRGNDPEALQARLSTNGVDCLLERAPDILPWLEGPIGSAGMPVRTVRRIVTWLS